MKRRNSIIARLNHAQFSLYVKASTGALKEEEAKREMMQKPVLKDCRIDLF